MRMDIMERTIECIFLFTKTKKPVRLAAGLNALFSTLFNVAASGGKGPRCSIVLAT